MTPKAVEAPVNKSKFDIGYSYFGQEPAPLQNSPKIECLKSEYCRNANSIVNYALDRPNAKADNCRGDRPEILGYDGAVGRI